MHFTGLRRFGYASRICPGLKHLNPYAASGEKPGAPDVVRATLVEGDYFGGHTLITERHLSEGSCQLREQNWNMKSDFKLIPD